MVSYAVGSCRGPSSFSALDKQSHRRPGKICSTYLDDVLIFSDGDLIYHWIKVNIVLQRLSDACLKLDPKKCDFTTKKTKYLGFIIETGIGFRPDLDKIRAISERKKPKDVNGVRSFLGLANFYRNFIKIFAHLAMLLHELTKPNVSFYWEESQNLAFELLKKKFSTAPICSQCGKRID